MYRHVILIFAEGAFEQINHKNTLDEANAYASGVRDGAGLYGAGSCTAYVMPNDKDDMERDEQPDAVGKAIAAWLAGRHT